LLKRVPAEFLQDAHHWLILHGRYVCKARSPDCPRCPVADLCGYRHKTPPPEGDANVRRPVRAPRARARGG
jgi:endonuclease-3